MCAVGVAWRNWVGVVMPLWAGSALLRGCGQGGVSGAKGVWAWPGLGVRATYVCVLRAQWAGPGAGLSMGGRGLSTVGVAWTVGAVLSLCDWAGSVHSGRGRCTVGGVNHEWAGSERSGRGHCRGAVLS